MTIYKIMFLIETESDTHREEIAVFTDLGLAEKEFKKEVKNAYRGMTSSENDFKEYLTESIVLEEWVNDAFEDTIMQQVIYSEGAIDRMNWRGNHAVNYYSRATYNGKELMHTMFYNGKREPWKKGAHKVPQSKLNEWYFR